MSPQDIAAWVAIGTGLPVGLGMLYKGMRRMTHILDSVERTEKLVKYHLGPNGDSPQMYQRVGSIDEACSMIAETVTDHGRRITDIERGRAR